MRSLDADRICKTLGMRIAELRKSRGLTQEQLGVLLGTSFQWVSQVEAGRNMTIHSLVRIANALEVPLAELFAPPTANVRTRRKGRPRKH